MKQDRDTELVDLDVSVRFLNIVRAMNIKTLGEIADKFAPEGILQKTTEKIRGLGDGFYLEVSEILGPNGFLKSYETGKFPEFARTSVTRKMQYKDFDTIKEVLPPHPEFVSELGLSKKTESILTDLRGWRGFPKYTVREFVCEFVLLRPNSKGNTSIFRKEGHMGYRNSHDRRLKSTESLKERLNKAFPEIKRKLEDLGYLAIKI